MPRTIRLLLCLALLTQLGTDWDALGRWRKRPKATPMPPPVTYDAEDQETDIRRRLVFAWWLHPDWPDKEPDPDAARAQVESYIHRNLHADERFTDEEIARFNRQRLLPPAFDPYGTWLANSQQ